MKYLQFLTIMVVAVTLSSCATILTGTTQRVTIDSTPQGANIVIDGRLMGKTPAKVRLDRELNSFINDGKDISLEMNGYYTDGYFLGADIEPTCILNVFCPIGFAFDAVTGAMMKYDSDYYNFRLLPFENGPLNQGTSGSPNLSNNTGTSPSSSTSDNSNSEDDYEKLMKLVDLYENGLLTEAEFEAQKAKIFENKRQ